MTERKNIYLDHNATTPARAEVRDVVMATLGITGNASSTHKAGRAARRIIEDARGAVARFVNAGPQAVVIFTSGATEANNLVLKGAGCTRILVAATEHPSVLNVFPAKEIIPVHPNGLVDMAALENMLETGRQGALVSVMLVNNETGVVQPVEEIVKLVRKHNGFVHTDAVQAAGRIPLDIQKLGVDYLTLSAHKMGGVQGAGCLVLSNCVTVTPQTLGGNQEKNMRAGTENLAAIAGFAKAMDIADVAAYQKIGALRDKLESELKRMAPDIKIFGADAPRVINTSMFALPGVEAETQLIALDLGGICVSNGSACSSGTVKPSHVLAAMGAGRDASCALRVSLGWNSTEKDVECFISEWKKMYERVSHNRHSRAGGNS